jgi:hypothetical protein
MLLLFGGHLRKAALEYMLLVLFSVHFRKAALE